MAESPRLVGRFVPRTLRSRLTAVATVVVALVLAATAVAVLTVQRSQLTATLDGALEQRADTLSAELAITVPVTPLPSDDEDRAAQLVSVDGAVLAATSNLVGAGPLGSPRDAVSTRDDLPLEDDSYRLLSRLVDSAAGLAVLHVAENTDDLDEAVRDLRAILAAALAVAVIVLAAVIWWLTGRTLRPVETLRVEVDAITEAASGRRVQVPAARDEIARLATTMNRMLDRLDDAAERQRRFVADAAHELRTPLTRIRTDVEVDLARPDRAEPLVTHASVRDEAIALQALIDDLLHLARSDAGHPATSRRPIDLDDIVLAEVQRLRDETDIEIDASGVSGAHLLADPDHLTRAVRNLLTNAAHHARGRITVTLREDGGRVHLVVADDGAGVPEDQRERVFERFARLDDARSRGTGGTGLGLAITRDIVEAHDGAITCGEAEQGGARFEIDLPGSGQIAEP